MSQAVACPLCAAPAEIVWQDDFCHVIFAGEHLYPGFCRVIWKQHVAEMTDLTLNEQRHLLNVVFTVERALRTLQQPTKINLASLGNMVPHLHWHVIPRWTDDSHFPDPVWAPVRRNGTIHPAPSLQDLRDQIDHALAELTAA